MLRYALIILAILAASPAAATEAGWALVRNGGQIILLNHANAPGGGDPANFDIEACGTQRNLSDRGRQQARQIGVLFAVRAAPVDQVYTSRYCRARQTAELAFGASLVEPLEALDLLNDDEALQAEQTEAIHALIRDFTGSGNLVLVTHDANIKAIAGVDTREGDAVIVTPEGDGFHVAGRIAFN